MNIAVPSGLMAARTSAPAPTINPPARYRG